MLRRSSPKLLDTGHRHLQPTKPVPNHHNDAAAVHRHCHLDDADADSDTDNRDSHYDDDHDDLADDNCHDAILNKLPANPVAEAIAGPDKECIGAAKAVGIARGLIEVKR